MKKWLFYMIATVLLLSGCGSSESLDKDDLRSILDYSANGFAEIMLETQTIEESDDYFEDKTNELIEGIEENNETLSGATTDEKSLKEDIEEYNELIIQALHDFLNYDPDSGTDTEASFNAGQKLREIVDEYFDGELPEKYQELLDYLDSVEESSTNSFESTPAEPYTPTTPSSSEEETSDITILSENPTSGQKAILDELARTQFDEEFPYKGSKIHTFMGLIQDWTVSGEEWYYKAEATIVNEFGAERKVNVEIYIAPLSADSGVVTITAY